MGTEDLTLYNPVVNVYTTKCDIQELHIPPLCFMWILEQTTIISLYSVK